MPRTVSVILLEVAWFFHCMYGTSADKNFLICLLPLNLGPVSPPSQQLWSLLMLVPELPLRFIHFVVMQQLLSSFEGLTSTRPDSQADEGLLLDGHLKL